MSGPAAIDVVESILPYDAPRPDQVGAAFMVLAGLARHLANATRSRAVLPTPVDLHTALGYLDQLLRDLHQLTVQVTNLLDVVAVDDRVRSDALPGAGRSPMETALGAAIALGEAAAQLGRAGDSVGRAHSHTSHLYWDDETAD